MNHERNGTFRKIASRVAKDVRACCKSPKFHLICANPLNLRQSVLSHRNTDERRFASLPQIGTDWRKNGSQLKATIEIRGKDLPQSREAFGGRSLVGVAVLAACWLPADSSSSRAESLTPAWLS